MSAVPSNPNKGLSIERLHALCRVAEHGGISKAAPDSASEQSKISSWLRDLSSCFEVELTERRGKGIALTPKGEELVRLCREHFLALEDFSRRCKNEPPVITIGAGDSFLQWLVLPRLEKIRAALNNPRIEISSSRTEEIDKRITDLSLDFGLIRDIDVPKQCSSAAIGTFSYSIWVPKKLAPSTAPTQLKKILENLPFALVKNPWGPGFDDLAFKSANIKIRVAVLCDSFPQALRAVTETNCAAVLPNIVKPFIDENQFVKVEPTFLKQIKHEVCLAWNPRFTHVKTTLGKNAVNILRENLKFPNS